jgi:hypothetical protein
MDADPGCSGNAIMVAHNLALEAQVIFVWTALDFAVCPKWQACSQRSRQHLVKCEQHNSFCFELIEPHTQGQRRNNAELQAHSETAAINPKKALAPICMKLLDHAWLKSNQDFILLALRVKSLNPSDP